MSNTLTAIANIIDSGCFSPKPKTTHCYQRNRVNAQGDLLEDYVLDAHANTFAQDGPVRDSVLQTVFSYLGNAKNPPDAMLFGGDAIEVKKFEGICNDDLPLNSSFPKDKLHSHNHSLNEVCRNCEVWTSKDMVYYVGFLEANCIKRLWIAYGDCFCSDESVYMNIANTISAGLKNIAGISLIPSKELARIHDIDVLKRTVLRVRGMWTIENPNKLFESLVNYNTSAEFQLFCIMTSDKYNSFTQNDRDNLIQRSDVTISTATVIDPNNDSLTIDVTIISYTKQ